MDPVWGIFYREEDPTADKPFLWRGTNFLGEARSAVREAVRERETGSTHWASASWFGIRTANAGTGKSSTKSRPGRYRRPTLGMVHLRSFRHIFRKHWPVERREGFGIASAVDADLVLAAPALSAVLRCLTTFGSRSKYSLSVEERPTLRGIGLLFVGRLA